MDSLNDWSLAIKRKGYVDVAFIDFAKAFDSVSHPKLFAKLQCYGIAGNLHKWIISFLLNRTIKTRIRSAYSITLDLKSGIVQSSCIGPLLFIIYINDVTDLFNWNIKCSLYAYDVKLYSVIDSEAGCFILQSAIDELVAWSVKWQLKICHTKCMTIRISLRVTNMYSYHISNDFMQSPVIIRDLGILVKTKLNLSQHLRPTTAKAHARCCVIFKCFLSKDPVVLYRAIVVYVRPLLESPLDLGRHVRFLALRWLRQSGANIQKGFEGCQTLTTRIASPFLINTWTP